MMRAQLLIISLAIVALQSACAVDGVGSGGSSQAPSSTLAEAPALVESTARAAGEALPGPEPHAAPVLQDATATAASPAVESEAKAAEAVAEAQPVMAEARRVAECAEAVEARAEFAPLRARSPDPAAMTFKHFADESLPDAGERDLIRRFVEAIGPCRPHFVADTGEARLIRLAFGNQEKLYAELASGQLSWGQFNKRTHDLDILAETEARRLAAR
jgi:hypothetical protein